MPEKDGHSFNKNVTPRVYRARLDRNRRRLQRARAFVRRLRHSGKRLRRYLERAEKREARKNDGPAKVVSWCLSKRGVTESPPNSNRGPEIDVWTRFTGYNPPVYWCGCFAAYAACKIGGAEIPNPNRLGYHGYIISDARARQNGLVAVPVSEARAGDIVAYSFAHIGVIVGPTTGGQVHTVEGNTSSQDGGSQNNGGMVAERRRPVSDVAVIARPSY